MKKEIEVKAKLVDEEAIKQKLVDLGCVFSEPIDQDDAWFVNFTTSYTTFMPKTNFIRIRKSKGKVLFTLKHPQANELDCIEKETDVSNEKELRGILEMLGYHEVVGFHKRSMKAEYRDYGIYLDEITDLGSFIEVEKITEESDGEKVQEELFIFLESLGIKREDRVVNGYDTLVYIKNNPEK